MIGATRRVASALRHDGRFRFSVALVLLCAVGNEPTLGFTTIRLDTHPYAIAVNPATNRIYIAGVELDSGPDSLTVIDGRTERVLTHVELDVPLVLSHIAVNPTTNRIYIATFTRLIVVDGETNTVIDSVETHTNSFDGGLAVNPATNRIYIAGYGHPVSTRWLTVVDGDTNTVIANVETRTSPFGLAVNPETNRIYIAGAEEIVNTPWLTIVDGETNTVIAHVETGDFPAAPVVNPVTNRIYFASFRGVTVLDGETNTVIANVEIETRIEDGIAVNAATNRVYVAGFSPLFVPWLTIIDGDTNAVLTNLETETQSLFGPLNSALAVDSASDRIYLAGRISPVNTRVLRVFFDPILDATVQQPIDEDGSSVFNAHRGVVPVRFAVTARGVRVCDPLVATIAVTRTSGGTPGPINEGDYVTPADEGSSLGVNQQCEHSYNLGVDALGPGTYHVEILQYGRKLIGSADFSLR